MATCSFIKATDAINLSRNNTVIWGEICEVQAAILAAIDSNQRSVIVASGTPFTFLGAIESATLGAIPDGSGYSIDTATATIDANGTGGTSAALTPTVSSTGTITGFDITNAGSGYVPVSATASVGVLYDVLDAQGQTDFDGGASNGTFSGGDDYAVGEVITLSESSNVTVVAVSGTGVVTTDAQDETNFDGGANNGTFVGGNANIFTGYLVGQTITLNDGTVILVDAIDGSGDVTQFTISSPSTASVATTATLVQTSTTGSGSGFTLTLDTNNEIAVGVITQFTLSSAGAVPFRYPAVITQTSTDGIGVGLTLSPDTNNVQPVTTGSGALLTPIVTNGVITSVVINNGGTTYQGQEPIVFSHPIGSSASAYVSAISGTGAVTGITLVNGGTGYAIANPLITITHGTGFGFEGTVNTSGGAITSISIQDGGSLYSPVYPYVVINDATGSGAQVNVTGLTGDALSSIQLADGGYNYSATPSVLIYNSDDAQNNTATITLVTETDTFSNPNNPSDYYLVLSGQSSDRVIQDQLQYVIDYFTALGYNIRAQVNPATNNTIQWQIIW